MKTFLCPIILAFVILLLFPGGGVAQTWDEWFHQDWTKNEYHKEEIIKRWTFLETVSQGMKVVGRGLTTISNITNGELNLHRDFFGSRSNINPNVSNFLDFIEIINFQYAIVRDMNRVYARVRNSPRFSADEIIYVERVHRNLLVMTDANISELLKILKIRDLEMTDDERIARTDAILAEMREQRDFVNSFNQSAMLLERSRTRDMDEAAWVRKQYETN